MAIGKVDQAEVDFIATRADDKLYIQVTESMTNEDTHRRELAPLQKFKDNYHSKSENDIRKYHTKIGRLL